MNDLLEFTVAVFVDKQTGISARTIVAASKNKSKPQQQKAASVGSVYFLPGTALLKSYRQKEKRFI